MVLASGGNWVVGGVGGGGGVVRWCVVVCGRWIGGYAVEIGEVRASDTPLTDYFFALPSPYNPHVV